MNPAVIAIIGGGVAVGLGVYLAAVHLLLPNRPALSQAVAPLTPRIYTLLDRPAAETATVGRLGRLQQKLEDRLVSSGRFATPDADLAIIEWSRGRYLLTKVLWAGAALLVGPILTVIWVLLGTGIPPAVPLGAGLAAAVLMWFAVGLHVRDRAGERRLEMRTMLISYLTITAMGMASGDGRAQAMQTAAARSSSWPFRRLGARISSSIRAGLAPEAGLKRLANELGVEELTDVAEILATSAIQGAQVFETLLARADSLRSQLLSDLEAAEAARSTRIRIPLAMLVILTLAFILYPLVIGITG